MDKKIDTIYGATAGPHPGEGKEREEEKGVTVWNEVGSGLRDIAPILPGVVPFGMIAGAGAISIGWTAVQAQAMSILVFAGASQVAAIDLLGRGAVGAAIVFAVLVINLRFVMYSAAIAPALPRLSRMRKLVASYLLTDQGFAVTVSRAGRPGRRGRRTGRAPFSYYMGASIALWTTWQLGTFAGIVLGSVVPPSWGLDFTIPLMFLALLAPTLKNRAAWTAAIAAGAVAVAGRDLPNNLGLMAGALAGVVAGLLADRPGAKPGRAAASGEGESV